MTSVVTAVPSGRELERMTSRSCELGLRAIHFRLMLLDGETRELDRTEQENAHSKNVSWPEGLRR